MDPQTEKEPAPHKKTPPGWLWWSLLGAGLYVPVSYTHLTLPTTSRV